ncbi:probable glycosyltransferase At3g07620 [Durio zibethinus]|uniref:Probable glycosyltransferase At3g07620 n=1 Tax=Durio zibethinus TaxID=66656 RepID=A0A6P5XID7_DURZI|nr:probable glycosyltransferase At3g07620 [Durio zibethinus]
MTPPIDKPHCHSALFIWSSSWNLVLFLVIPLVVFSVLVSTLTPQPFSLSPLSAPWTWRFDSFASYRSSLIEGTATNDSNNNGSFSKGFSTDSSFLEAETDYFASNKSFSVAFIERETVQLQNMSKNNECGEIDVSSTTRVVIKRNSKLDRLEANLARVRSSIKEAARVRNLTSIHQDPHYVPHGPIYRNANAFHRSYLEMEKLFKIYVYQEGEPPMFHNGPCRSIYSSEGRFIHEMEKGKFYRTEDPDEALVYFLPFSVVMLVQYLYEPETFNTDAIGRAVVDYIDVIARKHPYWNRSLGTDHFMLSCHDWGPRASSYVPHLFNKSIRVLCNANTSEGFNPAKDASFPEINLLTGEVEGLLGGPSPSRRSILAFFAGRLHGYIRYLLLKEWKDKQDPDVQVYDQLPKGVSYMSKLKNSRFCLCPSGYEVASPRIVEAIYAECVPVLISDSYVPPFSDVLNWNSFSVQVPVKDIPNIKKILMGISQRQYLRMQMRVKQVQRHFVVNATPKRYDVFHMISHSIWLRRLNVHIQDFDHS